MPMPSGLIKRRDEAILWLRPVMKAAFSLFFRVRAHGLENLPREGAFIVLAKHQRWEDIPILGLTAPQPLYYVAKSELFRPAPISWLLSSLGGIPLNRGRPLESRRSLRFVIEHLHEGDGVVVFPEGTYYPDRMGPPKNGLVRMILSRASPAFVPVGIRYRKGLRTAVEVRFGRPAKAENGIEPAPFLEGMMSEIARLSGL